MRVAYVCADPGVPVFGRKGASIHVQEVVRALGRRGADVEMFAARFGSDPPDDFASIPCLPLPCPSGTPAEREQAAIAANDDLCRQLQDRPAFDLVYERYSLWSWAGMRWASRGGIPGLLEVNAPLVEEQSAHRVLLDEAGAEAIARSAFTDARAVLAVSNGVAAYLARVGVSPSKVHVVPNGVDAARFAGLGQRLDGPELTVGFVGSLKPWHGLPTLIEAARLTHAGGVPVRLLIVGDGPERGQVETALTATGLSRRAELTGAVAPEAIPSLLGRMDVAAAPYPDLPGFYFSPLKIMEYMAAGRAIVASRIGDIDGLLRHEETALLCPAGDAAAFADALLRLHSDPELRVRLGSRARQVARQALGWDRVAVRIVDLAEETARENAPC